MLDASDTAPQAPKLRWSEVDTVLLDMDGTLLDLRFDNYFWQELIPAKYAERNRLSLTAAKAELEPRFAAERGRLAWYCTDYWTRELELPIAMLKEESRAHIGWLPGAENFLRQLQLLGKRRVLVTNAHMDTLRIKDSQTGLSRYFDAMVSSHQMGHPKEHGDFWIELAARQRFDAQRTLFVDDSLPVLRAARSYGIAHIVAITHPDSSQAPRHCEEFQSAARIELLLTR